MRGRDKFQKWKGALNVVHLSVKLLPTSFRLWMFNRARMTQGSIGLALRYVLLKSLARECGENVSIHPIVHLLGISEIRIGNNVSIHPYCYIDATGEIEIGNDVSIAHGVTIMSTSHTFNDAEIPIKYQKVIKNKVIIEDNVWIGAKAAILAGNRIETGSIIAASSVVTKSIKKNSIVAGVPAKFIKYRIK